MSGQSEYSTVWALAQNPWLFAAALVLATVLALPRRVDWDARGRLALYDAPLLCYERTAEGVKLHLHAVAWLQRRVLRSRLWRSLRVWFDA